MTDRSGWEGILEAGETILWQGQPLRGILWRDMIGRRLPAGVFFTLFSVFWIGMAAAIVRSIEGLLFPVLLFPFAGLPFLGIGLYMLVGHLLWDAMVRAGTWYTLTDRTAFVATDLFGRRQLHRYPLAAMGEPELVGEGPGDVLFGAARQSYLRPAATRRPFNPFLPRPLRPQTGFIRIAEAPEVWHLLAERRAAMAAEERSR